jgi:hypothetical protein
MLRGKTCLLDVHDLVVVLVQEGKLRLGMLPQGEDTPESGTITT